MADSIVVDGDDVEVTVKTSADVEKVQIEDEDEEVVTTKSTPSSEITAIYTWELSFTADDNDGEYILCLCL